MALPTPERIGRYQLLDVLGTGSQGVVYAAELRGPTGFRKRVAIKRMAAADSGALLREGRMGALIRHQNVVDVYEVGRGDDGSWFMAMELVDGPTVAQLLHQGGPLPGRAIVEIAAQAANGLDAAHRAGLVHRDVKPSNLLVGADGQIKVSDLGIAAHGPSATGGAGTQGYRAPEQLDGTPLDGRADLFALGVVIWQMAAGTSPLIRGRGRDTTEATRRAAELASVAEVRTLLADAVPGLDEVVLRCLQPDPAARYDNGKALRRALLKLRPRESEGLAEVLTRHEADNDWEAITLRDAEQPPTEPDPQLPRSSEPLVGRHRERAAITEQLAGGARAITLKALSGMGKSSLALHVATQRRDDDTPVFWCALPTEPELTELLAQVGRAAGVGLEGADADALEVQLCRALAAHGSALLVLDGLERWDRAISESIQRWLDQAPGLQLLVTAHGPLGLPEEVVIEVGPLPLDDGIALLEQASPLAAASLPLATKEAVVRAVDGVPLGIRLAATSLGQTAPDVVLEQLQAQRDDASPLDQAITLSLNRLGDWAVSALAQLSVFEGRFSLEAATAVLDLGAWPEAPWPLDVVQTLWRRSLLSLRERETGPELWMLSAVRKRAARLLAEAGTEAEAREAHGRWFARFGERQALERLNAPGGAQRFRELTAAYPDLHAATEHAIETADATLAVPLTLALGQIIHQRGPFRAGIALVERCLELSPPKAERAALQILRADLLGRCADDEGSLRALAEAETSAQGLPHLLALVSLSRANASLLGENSTATERSAKLAMRRARAAGDPSCVAGALRALGVAKREQGKIDDAETLFHRARAIYEGLGDDTGVAAIDQSLGLLYRGMGRMKDSVERHTLSARANQRAGRDAAAAVALQALGVAHYMTQDFAAAETHVTKALKIYQRLGNGPGEASCRASLASVLIAYGQPAKAATELEEVLELQRAYARWRQFAIVANNLANVYTTQGEFARAETLYGDALQVCEDYGLRRLSSLPLGNLGVMLVDSGEHERGLVKIHEAAALARATRQLRMAAGFAGEEARALLLLARIPECGAVLDDAEAGLREVGDRTELVKTLATRVGWHLARGETDRARAVLREAEKLLAGDKSAEAVRRLQEATEALERH